MYTAVRKWIIHSGDYLVSITAYPPSSTAILAVSAPMVVQGNKHKKPPTFGHLPVNSGWFRKFYLTYLCSDHHPARKLKKSWVESKKIKSQWKAQKKRDGLLQRKGETSSDAEVPPTRSEECTGDDDEKSRPSQASHSLSMDQESDPNTHSRKSFEPKQRQAPDTSADSKVSLPELTRQAYSRDSLHTYKANSKRHDTKPSHRGNVQRGSTGGGRGASSGDRGREKGQPNMKFRMTAMLEKIKRDFA